MIKIRTNFILFICASILLLHLDQANAQIIAKKEILLGQSACLEGSLGLYGNIIQKAILARIHHINDQGGINGKKIKLISLNDDGDPQKTQVNIDHLRNNGVDMFIGNMGTRSILQLLPLISTGKIALFFPWCGDEELRNPKLTNIINGPGLLKPQLESLVSYVKDSLKLSKIAIFHADDDFSNSATNDLITILAKQNEKPIATAAYNRFTLDIVTPATILLATDPKIVICIATSMPTVKLINNFFSKGYYGTTFVGIDSTLFVGDLIKARGANFYYSSAVPAPQTSNLPIAKQYLHDLKKYFPQEVPNVLSFSYYISTAITIDAIQGISGPVTKEKIIQSIEDMKDHSVEGFIVNFDPSNRHAFGKKISIIKG